MKVNISRPQNTNMGVNKTYVAIFAAVLLLSNTVLAESSKKYSNELSEPTEGDYFSFDLDLSGMFSGLIDDPDMDTETVINNVEPSMTMTYHGDSCVNLPGGCNRVVTAMSFDLTLVHVEGSDYTDDSVMKMTMSQTAEYGETQSWVETISTMDMWMQYNGEDYYLEEVETETVSSTSPDISPVEISVGDTWTISQEEDIITTTRSRMDGGDWDTETIESSDSYTMNYNAESSGNVFVGGVGFDSIKVTSQEMGSSEKNVAYSNEHGIPVKFESYNDDGVMEMMMTLAEYRYANEPVDQDSGLGLPGFSSIAAASMIGVATLLPRKK